MPAIRFSHAILASCQPKSYSVHVTPLSQGNTLSHNCMLTLRDLPQLLSAALLGGCSGRGAVMDANVARNSNSRWRKLTRNTLTGRGAVMNANVARNSNSRWRKLTRKTLTPPLLPPWVFSKCTFVRSNLLIEFSNRDSCGAVTYKTSSCM